MAVNVLFVCLGNICRSPTAHGVFEAMVAQQGLSDAIIVDSAGTGSWHIGNAPDTRSISAAGQRGYDLSHLRARKVSADDFSSFHYILAMDDSNLNDLTTLAPDHFGGELTLFLEYGRNLSHREVPDPYYGQGEGFELVLDLIESASEGLLDTIIRRHQLS